MHARALILGFWLCQSGCAVSNEIPSVGFVDTLIRADLGMPVSVPPRDEWHEVAWRNETVHMQVWVTSISRRANLSVQVSELRPDQANVSADNATVREIGFVRGDLSSGNCDIDMSMERRLNEVFVADPLYLVDPEIPFKPMKSVT